MLPGSRQASFAALGACCLGCALLILFGTMGSTSQDESPRFFSRRLNPVELLTIQSLMHVPECAADKHCRSACRMVCQETSEGLGTEAEHAASLVAFGCCFHAPLIEKQVFGRRGMRETQLLQIDGHRGARQLLSTDLELDDQHSLQADFEELKKQEAALKKRLSRLPVRSTLPFKVARGKNAQGLMTSNFNGFNEGFSDGSYGWNKTAWSSPEDADQTGWFANNNKTRDVDEANDPWGTEWHFYAHDGKAKWNGRNCTGEGCPESSDGMQNLKRYAAHLAAVTMYGVSAKFDNATNSTYIPGWDEPQGSLGDSDWRADDAVPSLGVPDEESVELHPDFGSVPRRLYADRGAQAWQWPDVNASGFYGNVTQDGAWLWDSDPEASYRWCVRSRPAAECDADLEAWHDELEWRPRECNGTDGDPVTADPAAPGAFVGGSAGMPLLAAGELAHANGSNVSGCGFELVSRRLERELGYDVARGQADAQAVEDGLVSGEPSDEVIRHFLGDALYRQYQEEEGIVGSPGPAAAWGSNAGGAHMVLARGVADAQRRRAFSEAYNVSSAWALCLRAHRGDHDFPRACTRGAGAARADRFSARPYQARHRELTAPEQILDGIEGAFRDLFGDDKQEAVRPAAGPGAALVRAHPNQFEYGPAAVPAGGVQGFGPAWWERVKGMRDQPQTVEGRAAAGRDTRRLPGVRVESWNGWPTLNRALPPSIAVTPGQCCSTFMHFSDHE